MADFSSPLGMIDDWIGEQAVPGVSAAVWHEGEIVATRVAGLARDEAPVDESTLFALASVSKPLTAAAVMLAVDAGDLSLDTPVAAIVPEFGEVDDPLDDEVLSQLEALRDRVTVRRLLCHTSGLPENVGVKRIRMRDQPSLSQLIDTMCGLPLVSEPGETLRYSNAGFGIAARVLERATGEQFHVYLQDRLLGAMGLDDVVLKPDSSWHDRLTYTADAAATGAPSESYNSPYWRGLGMPWGGYFGTPSALVRFAASFFPNRESLLSDESRAEMIVDQTGGVPGGVVSAGAHWEQGAWGLGWEVAGDKRNHWTGSLRSPRTFCHWGQSGTLVWADPDRELALAVFGNRAVHSPWPLKPPRWAELSDALIAAADAG